MKKPARSADTIDRSGRRQDRTGRKQDRAGRKQDRVRTGRKQDRTGRKQDRTGREQVRVRTGRKQDRTGRKQDRTGRVRTSRKQDRTGRVRFELRTQRKLRGLNVQQPWARLLLDGTKTVEVRTYPLKSYKMEMLHLIETGGRKASPDFRTCTIGQIQFESDFQYTSLEVFRDDERRHCIPRGSPFDWRPDVTPKLYGWIVCDAAYYVKPKSKPSKRGMIGSKEYLSRGHPVKLPRV